MGRAKRHYTVTRFLGHLGGQEGFTLLELCIGLLLIGILVTIAVPVLLNSRKNADKNVAEYNLRIAGGCLDRVWFQLVDGGLAPDGIDSYRDWNPADELKSAAIYAEKGYVPVDAHYLSIYETRITWVNMALEGSSPPIASADIGAYLLADAEYGFSIVDFWQAGQPRNPEVGIEYSHDWSLLPGKILIMDDMYYWDGGWQPNTDNTYITLITLEHSGVAHFLTLRQGGVVSSGKFPWSGGRGDPGDAYEGDDPPPQTEEPPADEPPPGPEEPPFVPPPGDDEPPPVMLPFSLTNVQFTPVSINLLSNGTFTVSADVPEGYGAADFDKPTIKCGGATVIEASDAGNGKVVLKFDRESLTGLPVGDSVLATITGALKSGQTFSGSDRVKVIQNDPNGPK
ncbi:MAG: prepilin-type N-terminal cleavage/methylation domain-containing protein [Actinomycetota bacterium]